MDDSLLHVGPPVPELAELPRAADGYEPEAVRTAFEAFQLRLALLEAQLRVAQARAAGTPTEPLRADCLRVLREAFELAGALERQAQETLISAVAAARAESSVSR